jgi:hypothetical protein
VQKCIVCRTVTLPFKVVVKCGLVENGSFKTAALVIAIPARGRKALSKEFAQRNFRHYSRLKCLLRPTE